MAEQVEAKVFSVNDAESSLAELMREALRGPVAIGDDHKPAAYLVSKQQFDAMLNHVEEITDALWLARAEVAEQEGFIGDDELHSLLGKLDGIDDAQTDAQQKGGKISS